MSQDEPKNERDKDSSKNTVNELLNHGIRKSATINKPSKSYMGNISPGKRGITKFTLKKPHEPVPIEDHYIDQDDMVYPGNRNIDKLQTFLPKDVFNRIPILRKKIENKEVQDKIAK